MQRTRFRDLAVQYVETLARVAPVGVFHTTADGRVDFVNEHWVTISGREAEQTYGSGWMAAVHPDDLDRVVAEWGSAVRTRSEYVSDLRLVRPSGEIRLVHARAAPVLGPHHDPEGFVGTVEDVTSRQVAEHELVRMMLAQDASERRMQALFDFSLDAIVFFDDDGRYVDANPAACRLLGYSRDQLLTMTVREIVADDTGLDDIWQKFLETGEYSGEYIIRTGSGARRTVDFNAAARVLPQTHLSIIRDVTERKDSEAARQQYLTRLEILSAIDRAILEVRPVETIANAAVARIGELLPANRVSVALFDDAVTEAHLVAVWSKQPTSMRPGFRFPIVGAFARFVQQQSQQYLRDLAAAPDLAPAERALLDEGVRSYARTPLRIRSRVIGSLNIFSAERLGLLPEHLSIAEEVADRLAVAITNARLVEQLQASTQSLAALSQQVLMVQERERRDIARELHDEIGQVLTGLRFQLDAIKRHAPDAVTGAVRQAELLTDDLVATVRRLAFTLRPPLLDEFGLSRALSAHFERFTAQTAVDVTFSAPGLDAVRLPLEVEAAIFRLIQESLTNAARHAGVTRVRVDVALGDTIEVRIADEGRGFDPRSRWGAGLQGMRERMAILGGALRVESAPSRGTIVTGTMPLPGDPRVPA